MTLPPGLSLGLFFFFFTLGRLKRKCFAHILEKSKTLLQKEKKKEQDVLTSLNLNRQDGNLSDNGKEVQYIYG